MPTLTPRHTRVYFYRNIENPEHLLPSTVELTNPDYILVADSSIRFQEDTEAFQEKRIIALNNKSVALKLIADSLKLQPLTEAPDAE